MHLYEKFSLAFSTWYPSNRKAFFLFEKVFLYPTNKCGRFFAPFNKFLKKLCFEEHEKRQPLRIEQLPLMKYEIEILSVYGGIFRAHFLEVFVYRAYRSGKLFRYLGIAQAGHAVIERKTHVFRKVKGCRDLVCA